MDNTEELSFEEKLDETKLEQLETDNPIAISGDAAIQAVSGITPPLINFSVDKDKSVKDQAKDLVDLAATQKAIQDDELVGNITDLKKEELKTGATASLKQEQARSKTADKELQEASYGVYQGIAELIGLKKPLPKWMLDILMYLISPFLILWYLSCGLITGIVNITMDCVNSIVKRFAEFSDNAKKVIKLIFILAIVAAVLLTIYFFLNKYGILDFLKS